MGAKCTCYNQKDNYQATSDITVSAVSTESLTTVLSPFIKSIPVKKQHNKVGARLSVASPSTSLSASPSPSPSATTKNKNRKKFNKSASLPRNSAFLNRTNIQIAVLGYFTTGKKSLVTRIIDNTFLSNSQSELVRKKKMVFGDRPYDILFEVCPFNKPETIKDKQFDFFFVLYDTYNNDTFEFAKDIINKILPDKIKKYTEEKNKNLKSNCFLIGNKNDKTSNSKKIINHESYLKKNKYLNHYNISCKDDIQIKELMNNVLEIFDYNASIENLGLLSLKK